MQRTRIVKIIPLIAAFAFVTAAQAQVSDEPRSISVQISANQIVWQPSAGGNRLSVTVTGPGGYAFTHVYKKNELAIFQALDPEGNPLPDGTYSYEIEELSDNPGKRPETDKQGLPEKSKGKGPLFLREAGSFSVLNGSIVDPNQQEGSAGTTGSSTGLTTNAAAPDLSLEDQVIPDDLIVQGSACVGIDCVNNESFGFDTIRLKENNTRIAFVDTSSTSAFPSTDWQLEANESANGGRNSFTLIDVTAARRIFSVEGGAPASSLYIEDTGNVGFGTSTPVLDLHVRSGNTPALRLDQDGTSGFTPQVWDIAGNEANFFIRDVTSGSRLPFRIRPGAPTSSIDIAASGNVGIGTANATEKLHVFQNSNEATIGQVQNTNTGASAVAVFRAASDSASVNLSSHGSARTLTRFGQTLGGWSEILTFSGNGMVIGTAGSRALILGTDSVNRLQIGASGGVTVTGDFTVSGGTKNFAVVDPTDPTKAIYYAALEGPEAGTYVRGTARTVDGTAVISLPESFSKITEGERMTVQVTPIGSWGQLYVAERSPEKLIIRRAPGTENEIEFDYFVQGVRLGYLDFEVERPNNLPPSP